MSCGVMNNHEIWMMLSYTRVKKRFYSTVHGAGYTFMETSMLRSFDQPCSAVWFQITRQYIQKIKWFYFYIWNWLLHKHLHINLSHHHAKNFQTEINPKMFIHMQYVTQDVLKWNNTGFPRHRTWYVSHRVIN